MSRNKKTDEPTLPFVEDADSVITEETSIIQPITVTIMRQGFSKIQNRALVNVIDKLQSSFHDMLNGIPNAMHSPESWSNEKASFKIPIADFGVPKNNYAALRETLKKMAHLPVEIPYKSPTGKLYDKITSLCTVLIPKDKYSNYVIIEMDKDVAMRLMSLDFGHQYLYKSVILHKCKNKYSQRIYMLITAWKKKKKFIYSTTEFRRLLMIDKKYKEFRLLVYNVLEPARKELYELAQEGKSDCYFEYKKLYQGRRHTKEPDQIEFTVIESEAMKEASKEDEMELANIRNTFKTLIERHCGLSSDISDKYSKMITKENYASALENFMNIVNYVRSNTFKIFDVKKYVTTSLDNFFKKEEEPIIIESQ